MYNESEDIVQFTKIKDLSDIELKITNIVNTYSDEYGKTREVGIWSHAGWHGPIGAEPTKVNPFEDWEYQMSETGWSKIDFNWAETGANATFYGCNTGNEYDDGVWDWIICKNYIWISKI